MMHVVSLVPGLDLILFALLNIWTIVASWSWPSTATGATHCEVVQGSKSLRLQPSVAYQHEVQGVDAPIQWSQV